MKSADYVCSNPAYRQTDRMSDRQTISTTTTTKQLIFELRTTFFKLLTNYTVRSPLVFMCEGASRLAHALCVLL